MKFTQEEISEKSAAIRLRNLRARRAKGVPLSKTDQSALDHLEAREREETTVDRILVAQLRGSAPPF